jgi:murein DD-endopeptidase MepM/ murein hydrolase activator NlpD
VAAAALVVVGCATLRPSAAPLHPPGPRGSWYAVQAGDTVATIAARTGVPAEDLLEINGLAPGATLEPGRVLFVLEPEGSGPAAGATSATAAPPPLALAPDGPAAPLRWPLEDPRMSSPFGARQGRVHEGIDLAAPIGTSIRAAEAGQVLYSGDAVRGYGNMVVVQHAGDLLTVYAHNSVLLVHTGDKIAAGQEIALVGQSGRATAPHLHFEVRRGQVPQDPLRFLPRLGAGK